MKLGVLSDIHSGIRPLEACVAALKRRGVQGFLLLGDYVSDCPEPEQTMELLRQLMRDYPCWAVRGNREEYMLEWRAGARADWCYGSGRGSLLYTAEHLSGASLDWFDSLPITRRVELPGCLPLRICHGGPQRTRQLLLPGSAEAREALEALDTPYLIGGHSHRQIIFSHKGRTLVNPGPVRGHNTAQCGLLSGGEKGWSAELMAFPYDAEGYADEIGRSELAEKAPMWARAVQYELRNGVDALEALASRAWAAIRALDSPGPEEQERCWERAGAELGL